MHFEKENSAFSNSVLKMHIIYAMTQVSQGILSTIVATACCRTTSSGLVSNPRAG